MAEFWSPQNHAEKGNHVNAAFGTLLLAVYRMRQHTTEIDPALLEEMLTHYSEDIVSRFVVSAH